MPLTIHFDDPDTGLRNGRTSPAEGSPVLFLDGDEWSVMLDDGTVLNESSSLRDPTPVVYWPLVALLTELAKTLNVDASDDACRTIQALLSDNLLVAARRRAQGA